MKRARKHSIWRTRAENPLNIWVFMSVHPAILLAEFSVSNRSDLQAHLVAMAFTWYGLISSIGLFIILRALLRRLKLLRQGLWVVLVLFGATVGLSADMFTLLFEGQSLEYIFGRFPQDYQFALLLGSVLSIGSALFETVREDYSATRQVIISEKVRQASSDTPVRSQILASFIEGAKERLSGGGSNGEVKEFAKELRVFVNDELRPMSHTLWEKEERAQRKFSLQFLVQRVISQPIRNPIPVAAFGALAATRSTLARDPETGLVNIFAIFLIICLVLYGFAMLVDRFPIPKPFDNGTLIISASLAGAAVTAIAPLFPSYDSRTVLFRYWLLATLILLIAGSVTTFIHEIRKLLSDQAKDLRNLLSAGDLTNEQAMLLASIRARDAADYLHSTTQNRLLALAFRLESKRDGIEGLDNDDLSELNEILEDALVVRGKAGHIIEGLEELKANWKGLLDIEIHIEPGLDLTPTTQELLFLAIREAASNAYRHGTANKLWIELMQLNDQVEVTISDNGIGPQNGNLGLGAKIYSLAGNWTLRENPEGGAILRILA